MPGAEDPYVDTVDEIVASLRQDPVLVQQPMGNGHTAEVDAHLTQLLEQLDLPVPVYVVLSVKPRDIHAEDPTEELGHLLHGRLGDGIYLVATTGSPSVQELVYGHRLTSYDSGATHLSVVALGAEMELGDALADEGHADLAVSMAASMAIRLELLAEDIESKDIELDDAGLHSDGVLTSEQLETYSTSTWTYALPKYRSDEDYVEAPEAGLSTVVGVAVALTVAAVGYRLLQALSAVLADHGSRAARGPAPADLEVLRSETRAGIEALASGLATPPDQVDAAILDAREVASDCVDSAGRLVDGSQLDVVAASVLVRTAEHAVARPLDEPYRCCFVNPLHGASTVRAALGGREGVPVCDRCSQVLRRAKPLDPLVEDRLGPDRPWYEGSSPWADSGFGSLDPAAFRRTARSLR